MYHYRTITESAEWREEAVPPFNELIISWNARRPLEGNYLIYVSLKTKKWSPFFLYAKWGSEGQTSFSHRHSQVRVFQDSVESCGEKAQGFHIRILCEGKASLETVYAIHAFTHHEQTEKDFCHAAPLHLKVSGISQMALCHPRHRHLCSPTSVTAAVNYLLQENKDPLSIAAGVWDAGFDIFGNWVLNVAQAAHELGKGWECWVEKLSGFGAIYSRLQENTPVIVSIKGPICGGALPYAEGHLMVVVGYEDHKVKCMDPAFPSDRETAVHYALPDFLEAWNRRGRTAYVFDLVH